MLNDSWIEVLVDAIELQAEVTGLSNEEVMKDLKLDELDDETQSRLKQELNRESLLYISTDRLYEFFTKINVDCDNDEFVDISDWEFYADQINILSGEKDRELAKNRAKELAEYHINHSQSIT